MTYEQTLDKIHSLDKFGSRPGLSRIAMLFDMLGDNLLEQRFIHVAGTNGKGSTCQMISRVLTQSGLKTGLFISPYITDFRERIQINNEMIEKSELCDAVTHLTPMIEKLNEQGVSHRCRFLYFQEERVRHHRVRDRTRRTSRQHQSHQKPSVLCAHTY